MEGTNVMPIISLKCPNCGANLSVNSDAKISVCDYCGTSFNVNDTIIKNYNAIFNTDIVNIYTTEKDLKSKKDFKILAGTLLAYYGEKTEVVIPEGVIAISKNVFSSMCITKVVFPSTLRIVGEKAFSGCHHLEEVIINDGLEKIQDGAFQDCLKLKNIYIPSTIKEIKSNAFTKCKLLNFNNRESLSKCNCEWEKDTYWFRGNGYDVLIFENSFSNTPVEKFVLQKINECRAAEWKKNGLCQSCGGSFEGFIFKYCKACGKFKGFK